MVLPSSYLTGESLMQDQIVAFHSPVPDLEALAQQTRAYIASSKATNTIRGYSSDWSDFVSWAADHQ